MQSVISTTVSHKELTLKPGETPSVFEVTVVNTSDRFATFQVELLAPGAETGVRRRWYEIAPDVATKKPPGDISHFRITIFDTPIPGFAGILNLTIRTFSLELGEDRKLIRLAIAQSAEMPLNLELPLKQFQVYPTDAITLPVRVKNPGQNAIEAAITLTGIPPEWLTTTPTQTIRLNPGAATEIVFTGVLPDTAVALCQAYPFTIQALTHQNLASQCGGTLEVLPTGWSEVSCAAIAQEIPAKKAIWKQWGDDTATYTVYFKNESNLTQTVSLDLQSEDQDNCVFQVFPDQSILRPGEQLPIELTIQAPRPWWGLNRQYFFQIKGVSSDSRLDIRNDTQVLKLTLRPKLALWMQSAVGLVLLYILWALSWLNPENSWFGHSAAVNSIRFNGVADELISGANETRILRWRASGFSNPIENQNMGMIGKTGDGKAVRVVRYRPVDNDWVAAGLETGEIQLWHLARQQARLTVGQSMGDRVLDLTFTQDARFLFSGHGSGKVSQWKMQYPGVESNLDQQVVPVREKTLDFAIYSMALLGDREQFLAIAGRYNRLVLWDLEADKIMSINYPRSGGQDDYITSIAPAKGNPNLLVTADNQGYVSLWNMQSCMAGSQSCEVLDEWQDAHGGKPIRAVALSQQGCYLTSAGADGRLMLWHLGKDGKRSPQFISGTQVEKTAAPFNSVDISLVNQKILIASGNDDRQVRVSTVARTPAAMCDQLN